MSQALVGNFHRKWCNVYQQDKVFDSEAARKTPDLFGLGTMCTDRNTQEKYLHIYDDNIHEGMCVELWRL